jgi:hypothetical protein
MQNAYNIWQILNKFALHRQIIVDPIDPCIKFSENQFGSFRIVALEWTDLRIFPV